MTASLNVLRDELHLHLYGCLTSEDIFELSKDHYKDRSEALDWYAAEYLKLTGTRVDWRTYFNKSDGPARMKKDFLAKNPMDFGAFQARFNLMIALLPTVIYGTRVLRHVAQTHAREGLRYTEHRIFVPPGMSSGQLASYYRALATEAAALNHEFAGTHEVRIILSVSRNPAFFKDQYEVLRALQNGAHGETVRNSITGLDFCGVEEGFPPEDLADVFHKVTADNRAAPERALALLYHVGESFDGMSVFSAMRWIMKSQDLGAHRLGHAIAATMNPHATTRFGDGSPLQDPLGEARTLCAFLRSLKHEKDSPISDLLSIYQNALTTQQGNHIALAWNDTLRHAFTELQQVVFNHLRSGKAVVETCPTSNRIIGRIERPEDLPVFRFARENISMIISSDDPGIFATSLAQEEQICRDGRINEQTLRTAAQCNESKRAGLMAGRSHY